MPLLRAGLERAAKTAGLEQVHRFDDAAITIRTPESPHTNTPVEIVAGPHHITITISAMADPRTCKPVQRVVEALLPQHHDE